MATVLTIVGILFIGFLVFAVPFVLIVATATARARREVAAQEADGDAPDP